ncbi:hypothetical protein BT96DRAFT_1000158 [Gymnopus androsaceus JB14]|uniref:Uncharacterized protein n=1 Tax=Gymnopus androsaceus JB14 TaxID=1447944 RepID=A0A6A4H4A9_9AGAR|nr:hypothetical protein BT96DRAFT_1000158 [Gymnopus androsaceus JB14]
MYGQDFPESTLTWYRSKRTFTRYTKNTEDSSKSVICELEHTLYFVPVLAHTQIRKTGRSHCFCKIQSREAYRGQPVFEQDECVRGCDSPLGYQEAVEEDAQEF